MLKWFECTRCKISELIGIIFTYIIEKFGKLYFKPIPSYIEIFHHLIFNYFWIRRLSYVCILIDQCCWYLKYLSINIHPLIFLIQKVIKSFSFINYWYILLNLIWDTHKLFGCIITSSFAYIYLFFSKHFPFRNVNLISIHCFFRFKSFIYLGMSSFTWYFDY